MKSNNQHAPVQNKVTMTQTKPKSTSVLMAFLVFVGLIILLAVSLRYNFPKLISGITVLLLFCIIGYYLTNFLDGLQKKDKLKSKKTALNESSKEKLNVVKKGGVESKENFHPQKRINLGRTHTSSGLSHS